MRHLTRRRFLRRVATLACGVAGAALPAACAPAGQSTPTAPPSVDRSAATDSAPAIVETPGEMEETTVPANNPDEILVYIGSYTREGNEGVHICRLDRSSGILAVEAAVDAGKNPSYLAFHPSAPVLYAANELSEYEGTPGGAVRALAIDPGTGGLTPLDAEPTGGAAPCYVSVDAGGRCVMAANYSGGSLSVLPIGKDGRLEPASDFIQHKGPTGPNKQRQEAPHAHCIVPDPTGRFALSCDLGMDKVMVYRLDAAQGKLTPNDPPYVEVEPGSGPRHLTFHPNGRYAYVVCELASTLIAYAYDGERGALTTLQTVSTLPEDFTRENTAADIHVAPSGRFIYTSNRGHDSIAIFSIDEATGQVTLLGFESTQGNTPRNFSLDPSGALLLAANQDSNTVVVFRVDQKSGLLAGTGNVVEIPAPVCVKFR